MSSSQPPTVPGGPGGIRVGAPDAEAEPPLSPEDAADGDIGSSKFAAAQSSEASSHFERLELEEIDEKLYRASPELLWRPHGARGVYGGQVLGQTLYAAAKTIKQVDKRLHSLHAYFLRAGDPDVPIIYYVNTLRDGRSFSSRLVTAKQQGKTIFMGSASFQRPEPSRLEHQHIMPDVPKPWNVPTESERYRRLAKDPRCPIPWKPVMEERASRKNPIDMRVVCAADYFSAFGPAPADPNDRPYPSYSTEPRQLVWMKCRKKLSDDPNIHRAVLAYASDMSLLSTARGEFPAIDVRMVASLDHSMWFHSEFRADEWLLFDMSSPRAGGARGFTIGKIFSIDGTLVATCAQEGVMRVSKKPTQLSKL